MGNRVDIGACPVHALSGDYVNVVESAGGDSGCGCNPFVVRDAGVVGDGLEHNTGAVGTFRVMSIWRDAGTIMCV